MDSFPIAPPSDDETNALADWAECLIILEGKVFLSRAALASRLEDTGQFDDKQIDEQLDMLLREVERRKRIAPHLYPFFRETIRDGILPDSEVDRTPYEFLLWLERSPAFRKQNRQGGETEIRFNGVVRDALARYFGRSVLVEETSAISQQGQRTFANMRDYLCNQMNLVRGIDNPRPARKDGGVDIVAWCPFLDRRSAFLVLLCQCTVQKTWMDKRHDISINQWREWIGFRRDPLVALAIPFAVPHAFDRWSEAHADVDLILDRLRICEFLDIDDCSNIQLLRAWCDSEQSFYTPSEYIARYF